ncbi:MAG: hypothetical protein AAGD13_09775 [Pseudomonadota bacterium]
MTRFLPIALLALAGCDAPLEEFWPRQNFELTQNDETYLVRVQSDPLDFTYFTRVTNATYSLTEDDRDAVLELVRTGVGGKICKTGEMHLDDFMTWRFPNESPVRFLPALGTWQLVTKCRYAGQGQPDL